MKFEEWWAGIGRSYNPETVWIAAQHAMRERAVAEAMYAANLAKPYPELNECVQQAKAIADAIFNLKPE